MNLHKKLKKQTETLKILNRANDTVLSMKKILFLKMS